MGKRGGKRDGAGNVTGETGREQRLTEHRTTAYPKGKDITPLKKIGNTPVMDVTKPIHREKPFAYLPNAVRPQMAVTYYLFDSVNGVYLHFDGVSMTTNKVYGYTGTINQIIRLKALKPEFKDFLLVRVGNHQTRAPNNA